MKALKYLVTVLASVLIFTGCQKEFSMESGLTGNLATGSLQAVSGDCLPKTIVGDFVKDSTLTDSNYVVIQVDIATPGIYKIFSDTVNGFSFHDSGYIAATGLQNVRLKGSGKPIASESSDFIIVFDTTFCSFSVPVSDSAIGQASYTLASSANACSNAIPLGTYTQNVPLDGSNKLSLDVNVTTPGKYSLTAGPVSGMTFSTQGTFSTSGLQTIILQGSGTPVDTGAISIPITAGGTSCSFTIQVDTLAGSGSGSVNDLDTAWQFKQATQAFHGKIDDATISQVQPNISALSLQGSTASGDTSFIITFSWGGAGDPPLGSYSTATNSLFTLIDNVSGNPIYEADPTTTNAVITIVVTSYDATTKIIKGTYSGNAQDATAAAVPITEGKFQAQVN